MASGRRVYVLLERHLGGERSPSEGRGSRLWIHAGGFVEFIERVTGERVASNLVINWNLVGFRIETSRLDGRRKPFFQRTRSRSELRL